MTDKSKSLLKGATALGPAALVVGRLVAYTNSANLGGEGRENEEEAREAHERTAWSNDSRMPGHLRDAAQALHPGRILEIEPKKGGRAFEIETVGVNGTEWKTVFDADGRLLRDERN